MASNHVCAHVKKFSLVTFNVISLLFSFIVLAAPPKQAPPEIAFLRSTMLEISVGQSVILTWDKSSTYTDPVTYNLYKANGIFTPVSILSATEETSIRQTLNTPGTWQFIVEACDTKACGSTKSITISVVDVPGTVRSLQASQSTANVDDIAEITWQPPFGYSGHVNYNVYQSDTDTSNKVQIASKLFSLTYDYQVTFVGVNNIYVEACNYYGGCSDLVSVQLSGINAQGELPPDPVDIAPPVKLTEFQSFQDKYSFLYDSATPVQKDIQAGVIDAELMAIIKGKVLDRDNTPVSGVRVSILGHDELGWTLSREDGEYDLVINGGGANVVSFTHSDYLPVQRRVLTSWQEFSHAPDVVMTKVDPIVTTINASSSEIQIATGSTMTDADGQRTAKILFPANTQATMTLPDGSQQSLTTLNVRATEYTVGENGPNAMPGTLPPTSGYTYAVELSVDEAIQAGATRVDFNQALPFYVDNFLEFPVGEIVPTGWYDHQLGKWIASDNGLIVQVLAVNENGNAVLDISGDGQEATLTELESLNISLNELNSIAQIYSVGKSFWRVPITHFTAWDHNWPFGPPEDAVTPSVSLDAKDEIQPDDAEVECGSIIDVQNQVLGEKVNIAGTNFSLNYRSDGTKGYMHKNSTLIHLTNEIIPSSLKFIDLKVIVAGKVFSERFSPQENLTYKFIWDGKDSYERELNGIQTVNISVNYVYDAVYYKSSLAQSQAFAKVSDASDIIGYRQNRIVLARSWTENIGNYNNKPQGLGGWRISPHHVLDPMHNVLIRGNCIYRNVTKIQDIIENYAGTFNYYNGPRTDAYATEVRIDWPENIEFSSYGNLYYSDNNFIYRIDENEYVTKVAGNSYGFNGDGKLAIETKFANFIDFALASDGSIYVAERGANKIRKINKNGVVSTVLDNLHVYSITVSSNGEIYFSAERRIYKIDQNDNLIIIAGTGDSGYNGDNIPAVDAQIFSAFNLQVDNEDNVYFRDSGRIRKISFNGIISTLVGNPNSQYNEIVDGSLADEIPTLNGLSDFIITDDNEIYFSNEFAIYKIWADGIVRRFMGTGNWAETSTGSGGPALEAETDWISTIAISNKNELYTGEGKGIRKIVKAEGRLNNNTIYIPSSDAKLVYVFNNNGRHQSTIDAYTNLPLYTFGYNESETLNSITDSNGLVTEIVSEGNNVISIIAPSGLSTQLAYDVNGYLSNIFNPLSESYTMTYSSTGLMSTFSDLNNNTSIFDYDELGRLLKDTSSFGSFTQLIKTPIFNELGEAIDSSYAINVETASGLQKTMSVDKNNFNEQLLTTIEQNGTRSVKIIKNSGNELKLLPSGIEIDTNFSPDPRFKYKAPYASEIITKQPSGLTSTTTVAKSVILADGEDILSATKHTDVITVNGNESRSVYDVIANTVTTTSAEGRKTVSTLDEKGRVISTAVDGLATTYYTYTPTGEVSSVSLQDGAEQRTSYLGYNEHGYLSSITDALGNVTNLTNDLIGRVTQKEAVITNDDNQLIDLTYDGNSNIKGITLPTGDEHLFEFNGIDKETAYIPPNIALPNHTTERFYDLDKRLTKITYPSGDEVTFNYHTTKGQLTSINTPQGDISMSYHPTTGLLTYIEAANGQQLNYQYDGDLLLSERWANGTVGEVSRAYNNHFLVTSLNVNSDAVAYSYDKDNLVVQAGDLTLTRNPLNGSLTSTHLASLSTNQTLNSFSEVMNYQALYNSTSLFDVDYTRNSLGRIISLTETINGQTTTFDYSYDQLGQLIEVKQDGVINQSYQFDANGNRTLHNGVAATYDAQDRLLTRGTATYLYDANGALISITDNGNIKQFSYDLAGNLLSATVDGKTIDYIIDGKNRRVGKKVNGAISQRFIYQDQLNPIAELDKDNNVISRFIYVDKINVPSYMEKGGQTYRIISDHLGSVRLVVNVADGSIAQQLSYDVNGNVVEDTNPNFQPFGYAGGIYDTDTGLERFGARDYDPRSARWTTKDPIRFDGGINLYGYVNNDPVNFIDLSGNSPFHVITAGVCIASTVGSYLMDMKSIVDAVPTEGEMSELISDAEKISGIAKCDGKTDGELLIDQVLAQTDLTNKSVSKMSDRLSSSTSSQLGLALKVVSVASCSLFGGGVARAIGIL